MKQTVTKFLFILFAAGLLNNPTLAQNQKYHRIQTTINHVQLKSLLQSGLEMDHYHYENDILIAEVSDHDIKIMRQQGVKIKYLIRDLEKNIEAFNAEVDRKAAANPVQRAISVPTPVNFGTGGTYGTVGGVARHFTFQEMQNELDDMRALYPDLITVKSVIGTTEQGRSLFMVRISDNADVDENEPEVYLNAVHHAREPISMTQLIFFMWHILENYSTDKEIQTLINSTEIYCVPCVNPDGYVYNATVNGTGGSMWRKNRHNNGDGTFGVDNNRNYGYGWGLNNGSSTSTSSETYRGSAPFSEPENNALKNFCNSRHFVSQFNCHSYGNYCIYPYSYVSVNNNPEIPLFSQLSSFLTADNNFVSGNSTTTLNYIASGVAEDWAYAEQITKGKIYGFTPEVGTSTDGFYPAASRIIPLCNSMVVMNKNLLKVSTSYGVVTTSAPASISAVTGTVPFMLKNYGIYPAVYTVSLTPLSAYVTSVDAPKVISGLTIFQTQNDLFNYSIDPATPISTLLSFEVGTDNGYCVRRDTITIQYTCPAPIGTNTTGITTNSANLNWSAISGAADYYVATKLASTSVWDVDILVSGSSTYLFNSLTSNTAYNWRVREANCPTYSSTEYFTTQEICGTPSPVASAITTTSFTLTWPTVSSAFLYSVQYRIQGALIWINSNVTSNSIVLSGLITNTFYEYQVSASCSSGVGPFSAIQTVKTLLVSTPAYCNAKGNNNLSEWIDLVQLGAISRVSASDAGGYINTGLSTNLVRGTNNTIVYSAGFSSGSYKERWKIYIDFNGDGDFADAGENIVNTSSSSSGNLSKTFSIPSSAALTTTRMRVMMSRTSISSPCLVFANGEVEDYTINIVSTPIIALKVDELTEVQNEKELIAEVSPNPFKDNIFIQIKNSNDAASIITLFDINGRKILSRNLGNELNECQINTTELSVGVYFLNIQKGDLNNTFKVVK